MVFYFFWGGQGSRVFSRFGWFGSELVGLDFFSNDVVLVFLVLFSG